MFVFMRSIIVILFFSLPIFYSFAQSLVIPGDFPDPSIVKIGDRYWATATTSNWAPAFPILESKDLTTWQPKSFVFKQLPAWADYYFWAPEISYDNGKVYIYYSAHKRDGSLCVGIASADKPEGPYKDHGPIICQEVGSIDAFAMRDENGKLQLIWKEDGNSINKPTPIWMMELSEDRTTLLGEKRELFRNDQPWEGNLVEGVSVIRHGEYFYAFYSAAGCCGRGCNYVLGIARAKNLAGPWEKYEKNPLLQTSKEWKCPGHGTPVEKDGRFYLLYHAYDPKADVYVGRQGVLSEFRFTNDNWIEFIDEDTKAGGIPAEIIDDFNGTALSPHWQWSVFQKPAYNLSNGSLILSASQEPSGTFIGQKIYTSNYDAEIIIRSDSSSAETGIALIGDEKNFISATLHKNQLVLRSVDGGKEKIFGERKVKAKTELTLRIEVRNGKNISVYFSENGKKFLPLNKNLVDGFFLPPWDRGIRISLVAKGKLTEHGTFTRFRLKNN
jgi:xylan 1,4-beta-xylosidase